MRFGLSAIRPSQFRLMLPLGTVDVGIEG